jgi:hypothetical protein
LLTANRKKCQSSGESGSGHQGSVGYWSSLRDGTGMVKVDGEEEPFWRKELFVSERSTLVMEVDLYEMKVVFCVECRQVKFEYVLPGSFRDKLVFAFVGMASQGDAVEIV